LPFLFLLVSKRWRN